MEPRITPSGTTDLRHSPPELHRPKASLGQWVGWLGGYSLYLLFHIVFLPFVLVRFMGRLHSGRYRGVIWTRFAGGSRPPEPASDWTLIIASGLGETRTGLQAAEEIYRVGDGRVALLTQLSRMPSALKRENPPFEIGFAPFNSPHAALIALLRWKPRSILFVEFSGNYHLAFLARMMGVRTALINVNLPENRLRRLQRKMLGRWQFSFIDAFCVQAKTHAERLTRLGVPCEKVAVTGIGLSPLLATTAGTDLLATRWRTLLQISESTPVILAGSTYPQEEEELLRAAERLRETYPDLVLILAPRHLDRPGGGDKVLRELGVDYEQRSMLDRHERVAHTILLDTIGELREIYSIATVAFVGGSLVTDIGGHTPLEALAWGVPITIGPCFGQQEAAVYLCEQAGVLTICTGEETLFHTWQKFLESSELREEVRRRAISLTEHSPEAFADAHRAVLAMTRD